MAAGPGPAGVDLAQRGGGDLVQSSPYRRGQGHRPQHLGLMTQDVDVGDGFPAIGEHHRDIDQDLTAVMDRDETAPGHRLGQGARQPDAVRQHAQRDAARVSDDADTIAGN